MSLQDIHPSHFLSHSPDIGTAISLSSVSIGYRLVALLSTTVRHLCDKFGIVYCCPTFSSLVTIYDRSHYTNRSHLHMSPYKLLILATRVGNFKGIAQALHWGARFNEVPLYEAAVHGQVEIVNTFLAGHQHPRVIPRRYADAVARGYSGSISRYPQSGVELKRLLLSTYISNFNEVATNLIVDNQVELLALMKDKGLVSIDYIRVVASERNKGKVLRYFAPSEKLEPWLLTLQSVKEEVELCPSRDQQWKLGEMRQDAMKYGYVEYDDYLRSRGAKLGEDMAELVFTREDEGLVREVLDTHTRGWVIDVVQCTSNCPLPRYTRLLVEYGYTDLEIEFDNEKQLEEIVENMDYIRKCVKCGNIWYDPNGALFLYAVKYGREQEVITIGVERNDIERGIVYTARQGLKDMVVILLEKLKGKIQQKEGDCLTFPSVKRRILQVADSESVMTVDRDVRRLLEREDKLFD